MSSQICYNSVAIEMRLETIIYNKAAHQNSWYHYWSLMKYYIAASCGYHEAFINKNMCHESLLGFTCNGSVPVGLVGQVQKLYKYWKRIDTQIKKI